MTSRGRRPHVVAIDLDGTLLRSDGAVSPRTVQALDNARTGGARVVVVTARPPRHVRRVLQDAGWCEAIAICSNGAVVHDLARDRAVSTTLIARESAARVAAAFARSMPEVRWAVETGSELVSGPGWGYTFSGELAHRREHPLDELWLLPLVKVLGWSAHRTADEMLEVVRSLGLVDVEPTHSGGPGIVELSAPAVTKAGALADFCRSHGVSAEDVIAFGDMPNDVPMLRWAGRSWAVANAHPEARVAATTVTGANDEDGVAQVLEDLFA